MRVRRAWWGLCRNQISVAVSGATCRPWRSGSACRMRRGSIDWCDCGRVALFAVVMIGVGLVYIVVHPPQDRSTAPYDDAIPKDRVQA